ncbi:hypothetical protein ACHAW5_002395 [Stephanodiscus triporus]|uniref:PPM-type phosphatase domain-containing protein n=1 Tax=Stephanodiscus triporus TaxID=2934178 RepID=A0ABD3PVU4_9STRA
MSATPARCVRAGRAMDLTRDHKPDDVLERRRRGSRRDGGMVRGGGRLVRHAGAGGGSLQDQRQPRAVAIGGDRAERPSTTHSFFSPDVMTSAEAVSFVNDLVGRTKPECREGVRRDMARHVVEEALRRGAGDNVTALVLWINDEKHID